MRASLQAAATISGNVPKGAKVHKPRRSRSLGPQNGGAHGILGPGDELAGITSDESGLSAMSQGTSAMDYSSVRTPTCCHLSLLFLSYECIRECLEF